MLSLFPTKQVFTFEFPHQVVGLLYVIMMDLSNLEVYMNAIPYICWAWSIHSHMKLFYLTGFVAPTFLL